MYVSSMAVFLDYFMCLFRIVLCFRREPWTSFPFFHNISIFYPSTSSLMGAFLERPGVELCLFEFVHIIDNITIAAGNILYYPHACVRHKGVSFHFSFQSICNAAVFAVDADAQ